MALFEFAESQIENLVEQERLQGAKFSNLTDLERGRLIVKFMSFKNKPMTNRKFYEYFYNQQMKSEVIDQFEDISKMIKETQTGGNKTGQKGYNSSLSSSIDSADAKVISDIAKSNGSKETINTRNLHSNMKKPKNKRPLSDKTSKNVINSSFMSNEESMN